MVKILLLDKVYWHNFRYCCFCQRKTVDLIFTLVFEFWNIKIRPLGLWKICHGSARSRHGPARSLSWLCQESVIALREVRQGGIFPVEALASLHRWRIPPRAMTDYSQSQLFLTDFSQSHDRLLVEPWRTPGRAMTDSLQSHDGLLVFFLEFKNSKNKVEI